MLYRISISDYNERFILKGGALLYAHDKFKARPTLDIDFTATHINNDIENIKQVIRKICCNKCSEDGTSYNPDTAEAEEITVDKEYHGVRVTVVSHLDTARQRISMGIGFGDIITPSPQRLMFPTLINTVPQAEVMAYSLETVVAEKFHAMISLSLGNSRMKDFFDVYRIFTSNSVDPSVLEDSIMATFDNRETPYEEKHPLFASNFFSDVNRTMFWNGFLKKIKYQESLSFTDVGAFIIEKLEPFWEKYKRHCEVNKQI